MTSDHEFEMKVTRMFYDWNDVDNTSVLCKGDIMFAGDSEGGMKVQIVDFILDRDVLLVKFERLPDSEWIELDE